MNFFDPDGKTISVDEFAKIYSSGYFVDDTRIPGIRYTQSSRYAEEEVMKISDSSFMSYSDVARVMAWKMGRIKHKETEEKKQFVYTSDWIDCENSNPRRYGKFINLDRLSNLILGRSDIEELAISDPKKCFKILSKLELNGIGPVYLITIIFFLSHRRHPIYDRYAMKALMAYENNEKPGNHLCINVKELPGKHEKGFYELVEYDDYVRRLDSLNFDYENDRSLDRALWIYGHAF